MKSKKIEKHLLSDDEKAKLRPVSLTNKEDECLTKIGQGSRTAGVKDLMELHKIVSKLGGKDVSELKYKLSALVESHITK